jgi:hypothetical protein
MQVDGVGMSSGHGLEAHLLIGDGANAGEVDSQIAERSYQFQPTQAGRVVAAIPGTGSA